MSDRGPSRGRHAGSRPPRLKQGGGGKTPTGGGGNKGGFCLIWVAAPPFALISLFAAIREVWMS